MRLLIVIALFSIINTYASSYTLEEKVDLLYLEQNSTSSSKFKIDLKNFIVELKAYDKLTPVKRIKKIHSLTQEKYLKYYSLYSFFPEIIKTKTFNCVTGSALYAIILDELLIPYQIIEVPRHVYLIAYPNDLKIGIESTSSENGIYSWSESNKIDAINYLINTDQVSVEEAKYKGVDATLEEYYPTTAHSDFDALVGMHLINKVLQLSQSNYSEAFRIAKIANEYYEGKLAELIQGGILIKLISDTDYEDPILLDYITFYYQICSNKNERKRIVSHFEFVVNEALSKRRDLAYVDSAYYYTTANLSEQNQGVFLGSIEHIKSIWYYNRKQYEEAYNSSYLAINYDNTNKGYEDLFARCLMQNIINSDLDDFEIIDSLKSSLNTFPFLRENPDFVNTEITIYATIAAEYFIDNDVKNGVDNLKKMEVLLTNEFVDIGEVGYYVADAYSEYATYLYRQKKYSEALIQINKAIKYDEESTIHQSRKTNIEEKL